MTLKLRFIKSGDAAQVRDLVLQGLEQRFGSRRDDLNPDLDDLQAYYLDRGASILVAEDEGRVIACGMLIREHGSSVVARIVRMSVHAAYQGKGIGRRIAQRLLEIARERGFQQVLVETNDDWDSALGLYKSLGFQDYTRQYVAAFDFTEVHMRLDLQATEPM